MQLVVTEKPSVAKSIATVIGAMEKQKGYFEGNGYLVSWCVGHLVELAQPEIYGEQWKKWTYESLPIIPLEWQYTIKNDTKEQFDTLYSLFHNNQVSSVVCATDAGREGELIFRLVYEMAECKKPIKRLWISSMEENAIREGFENLKPGSNYNNLYQSALCRQEADWLVGINGTRLFTVLYGGKLLKVGRVQTPTLAMLVERESKIMNFTKEPYYVAHILANGFDAATDRIAEKETAEQIAGACQGEMAKVISVRKEEKHVSPPKPYDLTTLQRDANRIFSFTAKQTLEYTQSLYEKKLLTYPRTDSQFLSDDMEDTARNVINAIYSSILFQEDAMSNPSIKCVLNSKKVTDHHAIIPTVEIVNTDFSTIPEGEMKILSLVANRLLCATGEPHLYETVKAEIECRGTVFIATGKSVLKSGWKDFEKVFKHSYKITDEDKDTSVNLEDRIFPEFLEGMTIDNVESKVSKHFTAPPKHFTEDSLLAAMEKAGSEEMGGEVERKGLGTPATRADIIEKLVKDGFVRREKKQMIPTDDGVKLITVLPDLVKSPQLTADWENALTLVANGQMGRTEFMEDIAAMVSSMVDTYHEVGDEQKKMFAREQESLGICPNCGKTVVKGKYGAYCEGKCGMNVSRIMGTTLSDTQIKDLLAGKKILLKGLKSKAGKIYDTYIVPVGTESYSYVKDGVEKKGIQFKFLMEFPKQKKK